MYLVSPFLATTIFEFAAYLRTKMTITASKHEGEESTTELDGIAIIGLATRFPQDFNNTENLWESLLRARSTVTPFPKDRFNAEAFYHPDPDHGGTVSVDTSQNMQLFRARSLMICCV
jgi:hypothetical protein